MNYSCTQERFLDDITEHQMEIIKDDGVFRCLKFRKPESSYYWIDIVTWPGHLCISGDCGTYVFARTFDMFKFFRTGKNNTESKDLFINTGYWAEKVLSQDTNGSIKEYSSSLFKDAVKNSFDSYYEDVNEDDISRQQCWEQIKDSLLCVADQEYEAMHSVDNFEFEGFEFVDFFEYNFQEYTFRYIWNLYAIVWGIAQYDKIKGET